MMLFLWKGVSSPISKAPWPDTAAKLSGFAMLATLQEFSGSGAFGTPHTMPRILEPPPIRGGGTFFILGPGGILARKELNI